MLRRGSARYTRVWTRAYSYVAIVRVRRERRIFSFAALFLPIHLHLEFDPDAPDAPDVSRRLADNEISHVSPIYISVFRISKDRETLKDREIERGRAEPVASS